MQTAHEELREAQRLPGGGGPCGCPARRGRPTHPPPPGVQGPKAGEMLHTCARQTGAPSFSLRRQKGGYGPHDRNLLSGRKFLKGIPPSESRRMHPGTCCTTKMENIQQTQAIRRSLLHPARPLGGSRCQTAPASAAARSPPALRDLVFAKSARRARGVRTALVAGTREGSVCRSPSVSLPRVHVRHQAVASRVSTDTPRSGCRGTAARRLQLSVARWCVASGRLTPRNRSTFPVLEPLVRGELLGA